MAAPDMDVIKEIPGYKVILKAVLKSQIQQLVEQLASSTDEESVILTASVADGTLCHLGSNSGKVFLEDHEDIKSQFLGFCLKRHHKQKQEKEKQEALEREEALARSMAPTTPPRYGGMGPRPGYASQRSPRYSAPHPITLTRASPNAGLRAQGARHHPYQANRPARPRLSLDQQNWSAGLGQGPGPIKMPEGQVIKIEPDDDNDENADKVQTGTGADTSQPSSPSVKPNTPSSTQGPGASDNDDAKSESSSSTIPNEALDKINDNIPTAGLSLDSDLSNLIKASTSDTDPNASQSSVTQDSNSAPQTPVQYDPNIGVKLEAVTDAEMDLEITGVELGQRPVQEPVGSPNWMPNISMQGASGSTADMSGYNCCDKKDGLIIHMSVSIEEPETLLQSSGTNLLSASQSVADCGDIKDGLKNDLSESIGQTATLLETRSTAEHSTNEDDMDVDDDLSVIPSGSRFEKYSQTDDQTEYVKCSDFEKCNDVGALAVNGFVLDEKYKSRDINIPDIYIRKLRKSAHSSNAQAARKKSSNKRVYNNYHACLYCGLLVLHIDTHLRSKKHKKTPEVKRLFEEEKPDFFENSEIRGSQTQCESHERRMW